MSTADGLPVPSWWLLGRAHRLNGVTIQDRLRHTSELTYGNRETSEVHKMYPEPSNVLSQELTGDQLIEQFGRARLLHQPGTMWEYDLSIDVLGRVVEVVSGQTFGEFLSERVFRPLQMTDTGFVVPESKRARVAQPSSCRSKNCLIRWWHVS